MTHKLHDAARLVAFVLAIAGCSSDDAKAGGSGGASGSAGSAGSGGASGSSGSGGSSGASGSAGSGGSGISGTGGSSSVEAGPGNDAGECNALENTGQPVQPMQIAAPVPAGKGGALPPAGVYALELTAVNIYTGVGGPSGPSGDPTRWVAEAHLDAATQNSISVQGVQSIGTAPDAHTTDVLDLATKLGTRTCPAPGFTTPFDYTLDPTPDGWDDHLFLGNTEYIFQLNRTGP